MNNSVLKISVKRPEEIRRLLTNQFTHAIVGVAYFPEKPSNKDLDDIKIKLSSKIIGKMAIVDSSGQFGWSYLFIDSYVVKNLHITEYLQHLFRKFRVAICGNVVISFK